jgi:hypothetical protein
MHKQMRESVGELFAGDPDQPPFEMGTSGDDLKRRKKALTAKRRSSASSKRLNKRRRR